MTAKKIDIQMIRGDTLSFNVCINEIEEDLDSAYFSVGQPSPNEDIVIFSKTLNNGITKINDGVYNVRVAPEDTAQLYPKTYRYDLELGIGNDIFTPIYGDLTIGMGVTQHE